jgi:hypothetical protein
MIRRRKKQHGHELELLQGLTYNGTAVTAQWRDYTDLHGAPTPVVVLNIHDDAPRDADGPAIIPRDDLRGLAELHDALLGRGL